MLGLLLFALFACSINAVDPASRTFEIMLPCRDGGNRIFSKAVCLSVNIVKLHTRVVFPRDYQDGQRRTTIIDRSPYGYTHLELINDLYLPAGFITIGQDMRGTEQSEGEFSIWHSDGNDSQDLGDWIVQQEWSDGNVFTFGASADGLAAFATVTNSPKWLGAQYFIWASSVGYDVIYPNGAYLTSLADMWIRSTVPDFADEDLQIIKENEMRNDWWAVLDLTGNYSLAHGTSGYWAGWYDIFLVGNLLAYNGYNYQADPSVRYTSRITVDPLGHCQDAAQYFTGDLVAGRTALAFAQSYETFGTRPIIRNIRNVTFYVMSSNDEAGKAAGQYWTSIDKFPEPTMTKWYLHGDKTASTNKPSSSDTTSPSSTTYTHDPANPIPSMGGNNLQIPCGPLDQSEIDKRSDVILFETAALTEELPLTGPIFADLFVSSDAIDTDFMVRISDVYPTGEARLLQDSAIRMRWRQGGLTPVYMTPGVVYSGHLSLWNTSYVFAPGHRIRIAISSSNYPRFDVNPNNGILLANQTASDVNITAHNTVWHSAQYPSSISLPVVKKIQLPKVHNIKAEVEKAFPDIDFDGLIAKYPDLFERLSKPMKTMKKSKKF